LLNNGDVNELTSLKAIGRLTAPLRLRRKGSAAGDDLYKFVLILYYSKAL